MTATITNKDNTSIFQCGDLHIEFETSPYLEGYTSILKWDNGYIECMAKYSAFKEPIEEYIDLRAIAEEQGLPKDIFKEINDVHII